MLGYKTSINKLKKIGIISSIVSDQNDMKLEINNRKKLENSKNLKIKQHTCEQPMGQRRNQKRKF